MERNVIIIGAGGHGKVIAEIVKARGDNFLGFLDDDTSKETLGVIADHEKYPDSLFVIGIGNPQLREEISKLPLKWYTVVHPSAIISPSAKIGEGTVVMANTVINADARIGKHSIINTSAVVEHDNEIGDFVNVSVGVKLGGTVKIGSRTLVGIGVVVKNNTNICGNCVIGAGAVVVKDIEKMGVYKGVPARLDGSK